MSFSKALSFPLPQSSELQMSTSHQAREVPCVRLTLRPGGSDNSQVAERYRNRDKLLLYTLLGVLTALPTYTYINNRGHEVKIAIIYYQVICENEVSMFFPASLYIS